MTLAPFTFCLPPLLGYLLFVGISGRLAPLAVPGRPADRPSWALGLWTGLVVGTATFVGLYLAWTTSPDRARALLAPGAWVLAALLAPALAGWLACRGRVDRTLDVEARDRCDEASGTDVEPAVVADAVGRDPIEREAREGAIGVLEDELGSLSLALWEEARLREETETHLRITRRALSRLEAESRARTGGRADVSISLEKALESRVRENAALEAKAARETARRIELETAILALERDVLAARARARRSSDAKAKAVSAATRSVALARQAVKARARLEERLHATAATLADREATIDSLVAALEKEKGRTRDQVTALARQLMMHERQLHARRGLEEVARSVEGRLTTRLARKVARARPVVTGN